MEQTPPKADKSDGFSPDFHVTREISADEIIGDIVWDTVGQKGEVTGKSFDFQGQRITLHGDSWLELLSIAEAILRAPDYRKSVSLGTISELIFSWLKDKFKGIAQPVPLDFLSEECEAKMRKIEVWIPIAETYIEGELHFGNVLIKETKKVMLDHWEQHMLKEFSDRPGLQDHIERFRRDYQGHAAATLTLHAEPEYAFNIALRETERSLSLLRCLCFVSAFPDMTSYSVPMGQENIPQLKYFLVEDGLITNWTDGALKREKRDLRLDKHHLEQMKNFGLDRCHELLVADHPTPFQEDILSALLLYSRSSLQQTAGDKLTYILAPLEFLLLDNSVDPQEIGERMAMLNGRTVDDRKKTVDNAREIYRLRSSFVRGDASREDFAVLEQFMMSAWTFITNTLSLSNHFQTTQDFTRYIDDWKLSGGLE